MALGGVLVIVALANKLALCDALAALWHTIEHAQHSIDLCTFIIGRDAVGYALIERLSA